jgi:hypothetical protein
MNVRKDNILAAQRETPEWGTSCLEFIHGRSRVRRGHAAKSEVWRPQRDGARLLSVGRRIVHWIVTYDRVF